MTREEVLLDTINYYTSGNRGLLQGTNGDKYSICQYINDYGDKCAVGRLVSDELAHELEDIGLGVNYDDIFDRLPNDVQELGRDFLAQLQGLHDVNRHWDSSGITEEGAERAERIAKEFNLDLGEIREGIKVKSNG